MRSRYPLTSDMNKWTSTQKQRADILFRQYLTLEQAYNLAQQLIAIYNTTTVKQLAYTKLARWYNNVKNTVLKQFSTVINTMSINYKTILNYSNNRSTNAYAESFNAKIKAFRAQFRGVRNIDFFLYKLAKLYA